jgi:hypothetical protein
MGKEKIKSFPSRVYPMRFIVIGRIFYSRHSHTRTGDKRGKKTHLQKKAKTAEEATD